MGPAENTHSLASLLITADPLPGSVSSVYTCIHVGKREVEFAFIRQLAGPAP